jgi:iron(III) transport system ATP-binding protein
VLRGHSRGGAVTCPLGALVTESSTSGDVAVVVRPEQVEVAPADLPVIEAVVAHREFYGHDALLRLDLPGGASATARTPGHPLPEVGATVRVGVRGPVVTFAV